MIERVGGGNDLFALMQAKTAKPDLTSGTPKTARQAEVFKALEEKQQQAADLIRSLNLAADDMKRQRKAAAQEKVERLKRELELLLKFGGDPKAVARQAAAIARELASAAKEYGSASGGSSASALGNTANAAPSAGEAPAQGESAASSTASPTAEAVKAEEGVAPQDSADAKAAPPVQDGAADKAPTQTDTAATDKAGTEKVLTPQEARAALVEKLNAAASENQRKASEAEADTKFKNLVRNLLSQAKALVEQQRLRAAAHDDKEFKQLSKDVEEAGKDIEQAFSSGGMDPGLITAQVPVNISV